MPDKKKKKPKILDDAAKAALKKRKAKREYSEREQQRKRQHARNALAIEQSKEGMLRASITKYRSRTKNQKSVIETRFHGSKSSIKLKDCIKKTKLWKSLLKDDEAVGKVVNLCKFHNYWIREPKDWKCNSHNSTKQIQSLTWHLFCKYSIPQWAYALWEGLSSINMKIFFDLCEGKNIRKCQTPYVLLTKRQAHLVMTAPKKYETLYQAVRYAQMKSYDCNHQIMHEIMSHVLLDEAQTTHIYKSYMNGYTNPSVYKETRFNILKNRKQDLIDRETHICSMFEWFSRFPMLDPTQICPMLDYICHTRRETGNYFNFAKRNPLAVIRRMEAWHDELARDTKRLAKASKANTWPKIVNDWSTGDAKKSNLWTAVQLVSTKELLAEGRAMNHCVGSYSQSCASGRSCILSFKLNGERMFTVNIDGKLDLIYNKVNVREKRGKRNRLLTAKEISVINQWTREVKFVVKEQQYDDIGN